MEIASPIWVYDTPSPRLGSPVPIRGLPGLGMESTRRRLAAHPQALNAVLQTARALGRTPDRISDQDVRAWGGSD